MKYEAQLNANWPKARAKDVSAWRYQNKIQSPVYSNIITTSDDSGKITEKGKGSKKKLIILMENSTKGGGGGGPPATKIINFFKVKKSAANGPKHEIKQ